jgi:hypothetical protein
MATPSRHLLAWIRMAAISSEETVYMPCMRLTPRPIQPLAAPCCSLRPLHQASNMNQPLRDPVVRSPSAMYATLKCPCCNPLELTTCYCLQSYVLVFRLCAYWNSKVFCLKRSWVPACATRSSATPQQAAPVASNWSRK